MAASASTTELYNNLLALVSGETDSKFYYVDKVTPMQETVRIFSYHYASYSDWEKPDALESRGVMFSLNTDGSLKDIVCRPMAKFFNYMENPYTLSLDLSGTMLAMEKEDGSLISSYLSDGYLYLKSKASLYSDQAVVSMQLLNTPKYSVLKSIISMYENQGYTCNLEYVAPSNRIVLVYSEPALVLLNVRNRETGEYISFNDLYANGDVRQFLVKGATIANIPNWLEQVKAATDIEGYVCQLSDGTWFKIKTSWYVNLHNTKDSVTNNKSLFQVIVAGAGDDIKALFAGDTYATEKIQAFEDVYFEFVENAVKIVVNTYKSVNGKERKDYAITSKSLLDATSYPWLFSLLMQYYQSGLDYNNMVNSLGQLFLKNYESFVPSDYEKAIDPLPDEDTEE